MNAGEGLFVAIHSDACQLPEIRWSQNLAVPPLAVYAYGSIHLIKGSAAPLYTLSRE